MKRIVCFLLLVVMLTSILAGCIGNFKCDLCGKEKFGIKHEDEIFGEKITYCDDCKGQLDELGNMLS